MNIYVDGSYCQITKKAGIGIVISNDGREEGWYKYYETVKTWCSLKCELIAVQRALHIIKTFGYKINELRTDCQVIVDSFKKKHLIKGFEPFCEMLWALLRSTGIKLKWIKRERNTIADGLARKARKL